MAIKRKLSLVFLLLSLFIFAILLLNSELGSDSEVTYTDLHRPEIVGEDRSNTP